VYIAGLTISDLPGLGKFPRFYFAYRASFPGLVWIAGAALYVVTIPVLFACRQEPTPPRTPDNGATAQACFK
jgi:hypothetical protein